MPQKKAFTLIELTLVVFIIGLIAGVAAISFQNIREKSRDSQRVSDAGQIQNALEMYYRDESTYPATINFGQIFIGSSSSSTYLALVPQNPRPRNDGTCTDNEYTYTASANQLSYALDFCLANPAGSLTKGRHCATPKGINNSACQ